MTELERLQMRLPEETNAAVLQDYLDSAHAAILARRYPYGEYPEVFPVRYSDLAVRLAVVMYNQRGVEGEAAHSENGVSRTYETASSLLSEIVPIAKVISRA